MNEKLIMYRDYFEILDDRTELKLFKKYLMELLELAESQQNEITLLKQSQPNSSSIEERWKRK